MSTHFVFRDDAYATTCEAEVMEVNDRGGIILDRTVFYATSGGQAGDTGNLELEDGQTIAIGASVHGADKSEVIHVPLSQDVMPEVGARVTCHIDWEPRYRRMRLHTALHLLSVVLPLPVTGGAITHEKARLDFDMPEAPSDKAALEAQLNQLMADDHPVSAEWISDDELVANPGLVKTMAVKPPMGTGQVRLVRIGDIDLQPCGGTHVRSTGEIGPLGLGKIEKKGRQNRRVNVLLAA